MDIAVEYRDIAGFPNYRVGNDGTVWSLHNVNGSSTLRKEWKQIAGHVSKRHGYQYILLKRADDGGFSSRRVHRLVLEAFVGPCPVGMEARHFPNRDKTCNRLDNLQWGTPTENAADRIAHGTVPRGEQHGGAKLTAAIVRDARAAVIAGELTAIEAAQRYGMSVVAMRYALTGHTWGHLDGPVVPSRKRRFISKDEAIEMGRLRSDGMSWVEIGSRFGCKPVSALTTVKRMAAKGKGKKGELPLSG